MGQIPQPHTAGIIIAIVAVIALSVAAATGAFDQKAGVKAPAANTAVNVEVPAKTEKTPVDINVSTDGKVNEKSTPVIVHVESTDERKEPVDFYHAVDSCKKTATVEVSPGEYKMTVTGVINGDGFVAKPDEHSKEIAVNIKSTDKSKDAENKVAVNVKLDEAIPSDKVTESDVKDIADATKTAIEKGYDSLKEEAGKAILDKVETNTKANTHLSEEAKETVAESTEKAQSSTETKAKPTVTKAPESASKHEAPARSTPAKKPAEKAKVWIPEKGHWENETKKVWVEIIVTVVDSPAYDEKVENGVKYIFEDGYVTYSDADAEAYIEKMLLAGLPDNYSLEPVYKTIHHDAVTHTENQGHYESKVTSKHWVVNQAGHYE